MCGAQCEDQCEDQSEDQCEDHCDDQCEGRERRLEKAADLRGDAPVHARNVHVHVHGTMHVAMDAWCPLG